MENMFSSIYPIRWNIFVSNPIQSMEMNSKKAASHLLILPLPSPPFNLIQIAPFFRQSSTLKPKFHFFSDAVGQVQRSIFSNVRKCIQMMLHPNGLLDNIVSLSSHLQTSLQIPLGNQGKLDMVPNQNFAAILPGDSVAGIVVANGVLNFLSIYNTLLVVRLVLTWFPNAPPAVVSPLSTICDPYLNIFRGIIPPLGGTLDLSPILAFLVLNAFTSTASALPAELPPTEVSSADITFQTTASQKKWMRRFAANKSKRSNGDI